MRLPSTHTAPEHALVGKSRSEGGAAGEAGTTDDKGIVLLSLSGSEGSGTEMDVENVVESGVSMFVFVFLAVAAAESNCEDVVLGACVSVGVCGSSGDEGAARHATW